MGERLPDAAGSDAGAERAQSCPLLGVFDDRAKRLADPSNDHRCWADEVPLVVDLPTQQTLCLQSSHFACPRYLKHSLVARQQPKVSLFDRLRYWLHTPH